VQSTLFVTATAIFDIKFIVQLARFSRVIRG